jgi:hypothetical protein
VSSATRTARAAALIGAAMVAVFTAVAAAQPATAEHRPGPDPRPTVATRTLPGGLEVQTYGEIRFDPYTNG